MTASSRLDPEVTEYRSAAEKLRKFARNAVWIYAILALAYTWYFADTLPPGAALLIYAGAISVSGLMVESWLARSEARDMRAHNLLTLDKLAFEVTQTQKMISEVPWRVRNEP